MILFLKCDVHMHEYAHAFLYKHIERNQCLLALDKSKTERIVFVHYIYLDKA